MGSAFIKMEMVFRNFVPRRLLVTLGFPALYFGLLTDATQTCQPVNFTVLINIPEQKKK